MRKLGLLFLCFIQFSCISDAQEKINGISFVASPDRLTQEHVGKLLEIHPNSAAIMPFGFMRETNSPEIVFDTDRQWFGETRKGAEQYITLLKKNGVPVMLKPQIWVWRGEFTGTIMMETEENWKKLEDSYDKFMLNYAALAEETSVPVLCIGTELEKFVENRPAYWLQLIKKIRAVYKGKLTYAANWDEYKRTPFWKELDYIGIDAYFPLSDSKTPTIEELQQGWQPWKQKILEVAKTNDKKVLFTEFGYRSMDYTAKKPWLVDDKQDGVNLAAQANAKKAIFNEFWSEDWFAGGYVWKWFIKHDKSGGELDNRFTPQNKPAQQIIENHYKAFKN